MAESTTTLSAVLQRALDHHRAGRLPQALNLYQELLAIRPDDVGLLVNHGIAALQVGRSDLAVDSLQCAVVIKPDMAEAHFNLGNALQHSDRFEEAVASYRQAVYIDPENAAGHNNLGVVLQKTNRARQAIASFRKAITVRPDYAEAYVNLCHAFRVLEDLEDAIAAGRRAIEISPGCCEAYNCYGSALSRAQELDKAISVFQSALSINPNSVHAQNNLAKTFIRKGRPSEALKVLNSCLESHPGNTEALATKCVALNEIGDHDALSYLMNCDELIEKLYVHESLKPGGLANFNKALARHVETHPTLFFEPEKNSTKSGWQSGNLRVEPKGPVAVLEKIIGEKVNAYRRGLVERRGHPFLANAPSHNTLRIWGVILKSQGHQTPHIHPSAWISGCYYVQVPIAVSEATNGHSGWIEFGRPDPRLQAKVNPAITRVRPEEGLMLLFPSFFYHSTAPFASEENRISISFDVIPSV
jgi:tetratricopeptide (TPR) repeat protein